MLLAACETTTSGGAVGAARAGYDPQAGVTLWRKMIAAHGPGARPPEFLSSHPADASRVQQIEALLPTVMPLYRSAIGRR